MAFDWIKFFDARRIEWSDSQGASSGNVVIHCPLCGSGDHGMHMAVSLQDRGWRCFRVRGHSGRSVPRLIQLLTMCSWEDACRVAGVASQHLLPDEALIGARALDAIRNPRAAGVDAATRSTLRLLPEFKPLANRGSGRMFSEYLIYERGYTHFDIGPLARLYDLRYAIQGTFDKRIIFPIYMRGELVNWTGRTISKTNGLRYRTLSADPEKAKENQLPVAKISVERTLYNYDNVLEGGRELLIAEGPFDAMKLDYYGNRYEVHAVATYTKSLSADQVVLLEGLRNRYGQMTRVLDNDAELDLLQEQRRAGHLGLGVKRIPRHRKDPDSMSYDEILGFIDA